MGGSKVPAGGAVDEQGLGGAADSGAAHLGVDDDGARHLKVGGAIHVSVADAFQVLEKRDPALGGDAFDQRFAAARHDDVDELAHLEHLTDGGAVRGRHQLDGGGGQIGLGQPAVQRGNDGGRRMIALGAAAQDDCVARLEAQSTGVGGDVGPRFIDHADDAERHSHPRYIEAVGTIPPGQHLAHRIGQRRDLLEAPRHRFDTSRIQLEAFEHGLAEPLVPSRRHVGLIGGEDGALRLPERLGGSQKRPVLGRAGRRAESAGGGLGVGAETVHEDGDVLIVAGGWVRRRCHDNTRSSL